MASYSVDGLVVPASVGGHPALDFCNTRAGWGGPRPKEYLHTYDHLAVWARENGLLEAAVAARLRRAAARDPGGAAAMVRRAVVFRDALYAVLIGPARRRDWDAVNVEASRAVSASALRPGTPATWELVGTGLELALLAVARVAADLLTSPAAARVGACPGAGCGWAFVDPRGRRRWCSMAWCGNRNKVRRHAERSRAAGESIGSWSATRATATRPRTC